MRIHVHIVAKQCHNMYVWPWGKTWLCTQKLQTWPCTYRKRVLYACTLHTESMYAGILHYTVSMHIRTEEHEYMYEYMCIYLHAYTLNSWYSNCVTLTKLSTLTYTHTGIHTQKDQESQSRYWTVQEHQRFTYTYTHTYIHTYIHTYWHTYTEGSRISIAVLDGAGAPTVYIYIHTHIHTYIHTYWHTYTEGSRISIAVLDGAGAPTVYRCAQQLRAQGCQDDCIVCRHKERNTGGYLCATCVLRFCRIHAEMWTFFTGRSKHMNTCVFACVQTCSFRRPDMCIVALVS
jgi:hypothetical protein